MDDDERNSILTINSNDSDGTVELNKNDDLKEHSGVLDDHSMSNDAEVLDEGNSDDSMDDPEDKPLLELMKNLINFNEGKQNTILTNAQLINILKQEFNIDISTMHVVEVDIYMNVMKKFLKEWPQWDNFDRVMNKSKNIKDVILINKMLGKEYKSLKRYLEIMLTACKPRARDSVQKLLRMQEIPESARVSSSDVCLEVHCTRDQLNSLIFRKPHPEYNNTIFNINNTVPSRITLNSITLISILNWWQVAISINLNCFKYHRKLLHKFQHVLVNKKLKHIPKMVKLPQSLQMKPIKKKTTVKTSDLNTLLLKIIEVNSSQFSDYKQDIETIFNQVREDIHMVSVDIEVATTFRYYMNGCPYVRYLCEDVEVTNKEADKYDIQVEEKVSPRLQFSILNVCPEETVKINENDECGPWLKLECVFCGAYFINLEGIKQMVTHFNDVHQHEPDWYCTRCDKKFSSSQLALNKWYHKCAVNDESIELVNSDSE